ncbi:MAG: hypothetical protein FH761_07490 [Firmicutes bacterium]|nr:hypothetical protein [Bacillota bacterium]
MNETEKYIKGYFAELNINVLDFIKKIGISVSEFNEIITNNKHDFMIDLTFRYAQVVFDEDILIPELKKFYNSHSRRIDTLIETSIRSKEYHKIRLMLNIVRRFVELSDEIECVERSSDVMKILFSVICIESLFKHAGMNTKNKYLILKDFFNDFITEKSKKYLGKSITRESNPIGIDAFVNLINSLRNEFVHEGKYWGFNFIDKHPMLYTLKFPENESEYSNKRFDNRIYNVSLSYGNYKNILMEGYVAIIENVYEKI